MPSFHLGIRWAEADHTGLSPAIKYLRQTISVEPDMALFS